CTAGVERRHIDRAAQASGRHGDAAGNSEVAALATVARETGGIFRACGSEIERWRMAKRQLAMRPHEGRTVAIGDEQASLRCIVEVDEGCGRTEEQLGVGEGIDP